MKFVAAYWVPSAGAEATGGNAHFGFNAIYFIRVMVIYTQNTNYSIGGMIIYTQNTNYLKGEMVIKIQDTNYSKGEMVIKTF